jgi:DNA-binding PadR family transcriptional regulator
MTLRRTTGSESGLTGPALHIMLALGHEAKHGYAIMRDIEERSRGTIRLLPGTLYSTMKKLLDEGLVEECDAPKVADSEDARRRYYRVTKLGKATAKRERERLSLLVELGEVFG